MSDKDAIDILISMCHPRVPNTLNDTSAKPKVVQATINLAMDFSWQ